MSEKVSEKMSAKIKKKEVVTFTHNGVEYSIRKKLSVAALEAQEAGKFLGTLKAQVGGVQWQKFIDSYDGDPDIDDCEAFSTALLDAMGIDQGK